MPYSGPGDSDLPDYVKKLPENEKAQWVEVWNSAYKSCTSDGSNEKDCESSAFAQANGVVMKENQRQVLQASNGTSFFFVRRGSGSELVRADDYPLGQLCPYDDCCHDLAFDQVGWYQCPHCERMFYAEDTDSDYEDFHCRKADEVDGGPPDKGIVIAKDLGPSWASPEEEETRSFLGRVLDRLRGKSRAIKDVSSWDGAASNYDSTEAYCSACLIDVNPSGETKKQSYCMLPVKPAGSSDYARQAIHSAAGGHGISQVKKPEGVEQGTWDSAVKSAANKIISLYNEMDETAPDSVYNIAGKNPPSNRAVSFPDMYEQVSEELYKKAEGWPWIHDIYMEEDTGKSYVVFSNEGKLYRSDISFAGTALSIGDAIEVTTLHVPAQSRTIIKRQADGKVRFFTINATAVLNRVGELDSTTLFDNFIRRAEETGEYPIYEFFHLGEEFRLGQFDFLARDGFVYIGSGLFDDPDESILARLAIRALEAEPDYWGNSIGYLQEGMPDILTVAEDVEIPVFTDGIHRETSLLPEHNAANYFTSTGVKRAMNEKAREALKKLFQEDPDEMDKFLDRLETTNRSIEEEGMIRREGEKEEPKEDIPVEAQVTEVVLDDSALEQITRSVFEVQEFKDLGAAIVALTDEVANLKTLVEEQTQSHKRQIGKLENAVAELSQEEDDKQRQWLEDIPRKSKVVVTSRPRQRYADGDGEEAEPTMESQASSVLNTLPSYSNPK